MAIVRWEPARELASMEIDRLNRMFSDFYGEAFSRAWVPPVDIYETDAARGGPEGRAARHEAGGHQASPSRTAC